MPSNLVVDAILSKDSYNQHNTDEGVVSGWGRVKVEGYKYPTGTPNFAAQLYKNADGSYKIAYRGTANAAGAGDMETNAAIVTGQWSAEMTESIRFTHEAIKHIQTLREIQGTGHDSQ